MSVFKTLTSKPWQVNDLDESISNKPINTTINAPKTALYFFIGVVTVLFFLLTITFLSRSQSFDFQALSGEPWLPFNDASILWQNSLYLLCASVSLAAANVYAQRQNNNILILSLFFACVFSLLFIFGQLTVWQQLNQAGFFIYSNPANSYFYLFTGVHGLHLFGGLVALARVIWGFSQSLDSGKLVNNLKLCSVYWHYLLIIWLLLFALLTSSADTFKTIALFCGF